MARHRQSNNKLRLLLTVAFTLFMVLPVSVQAQTFNAKTFTLDNGLQVVVIPNHRAPVATHMVWYKVGAADEPQGLSGMAHYFEHLMFKGTEKHPSGEFTKIVKKLGGNLNAFTGQDYTAYYETIAVQHLEKMMDMEADRMVNLDVSKEDFDAEKQVVLEERRQRTDNNPQNIFGEQMNSALYVNHPYGTPVIGWMNEIETYEWEDVKKFYDKWYAPNNAIVIVSGDVTEDEVKEMAMRTYGKLEPKDIPPRIRTKVPPANGKTFMTLKHKSINQPFFQEIKIAPSYSDNRQDALALTALQEIINGGPTTRLYKNLVVDQKKAVSVSFSYSGNDWDYGTISIGGTPADGVSLDELHQLVQEEINAVISYGVTDEELNDAVQRIKDNAVYARDSLSGPASAFGSTLTTGGTVDDVENWVELIDSVTTLQIQEVAIKYLDANNPWYRPSVVGHLLPPDTVEETDETEDAGETGETEE